MSIEMEVLFLILGAILGALFSIVLPKLIDVYGFRIGSIKIIIPVLKDVWNRLPFNIVHDFLSLEFAETLTHGFPGNEKLIHLKDHKPEPYTNGPIISPSSERGREYGSVLW